MNWSFDCFALLASIAKSAEANFVANCFAWSDGLRRVCLHQVFMGWQNPHPGGILVIEWLGLPFSDSWLVSSRFSTLWCRAHPEWHCAEVRWSRWTYSAVAYCLQKHRKLVLARHWPVSEYRGTGHFHWRIDQTDSTIFRMESLQSSEFVHAPGLELSICWIVERRITRYPWTLAATRSDC